MYQENLQTRYVLAGSREGKIAKRSIKDYILSEKCQEEQSNSYDTHKKLDARSSTNINNICDNLHRN